MEIFFNTAKDPSDNSSNQIDQFLGAKNDLLEVDILELIDLYDEISKYWMSKNCRVSDILAKEGMGFLVPWLAKNNISKLLHQNFQNLSSLNYPEYDNDLRCYLYGRPVGVSVHWIAGNVPVLGVISLFQTLLMKNKNIVKLPLNYKNILPTILTDLIGNPFFSKEILKTLQLALNQVLLLYIDKNDFESQKNYPSMLISEFVGAGLRQSILSLACPKK